MQSKAEVNRRYRERHPERVAAALADYDRRHPKRGIYEHARRRAKKLGLPFSIRQSDFEIPDLCPVLGIPLFRNLGESGPGDNSPSIDRIRPELGYVPSNIAVISNRANRIKSNASLAELELLVAWLRRKTNGNSKPHY
jgi:hypothetical protein